MALLFIGATETSRNITARVIELDANGEIHYILEESRGFRIRQHCRQKRCQLGSTAKFSLNRHYNKERKEPSQFGLRNKFKEGFLGERVCATTDEGAVKVFPEELAKTIEDGDYSADQVFNADETGLYWKKLPNHTYIAKHEKTVIRHKASKDGVTLLLCSNASGDRMLKPRLINKSLSLSRPHDDIDELLVGDALSDNDIIDLTLDLTVDGVVGLEGDNDEEEKSTSLTGKLIQEDLQLCSKLENHFLINAPNSERASKLQCELQSCMSGYRELYKKIKESSSQSLITDYIVRKGRAT
ncbi:tigger transposable element-derived protein 1 [Trichonephila clavipes]|nr:tigger transposable element-derived protein 1 [Trichonephila clavipes]